MKILGNLTTSGSVGIGTDTLGEKLEVNGNIQLLTQAQSLYAQLEVGNPESSLSKRAKIIQNMGIQESIDTYKNKLSPLRKKQILVSIIIFALFVFLVRMIIQHLTDGIAIRKTVDGNSMVPLIHSGQKVYLYPEYYANHSVELGDLVAYNYGGKNIPLIKQVRVTAEQYVTIDPGEKTLRIDGEPMKNSRGEIYYFSPQEIVMLSIYIQDGRIPTESYFIFGDNISDSIDSRKFGAVSQNDFLGKFSLH